MKAYKFFAHMNVVASDTSLSTVISQLYKEKKVIEKSIY